MSKITPCLWYAGDAEEAARFYVTLLPDSRIDAVNRAPMDTPADQGNLVAGQVLTVLFTLAGQSFCGLNGPPLFPQTEAVSFLITTDDQEETDRLWSAIVESGGQESQCGWCKDRWGVSWQITPRRLLELTTDPDQDRAARAMAAMMRMRKIDLAALEAAVADPGTSGEGG